MQDLLTLAATVTAAALIASIVIGYPLYVWHRTKPVATPTLEPTASLPEPLDLPRKTPKFAPAIAPTAAPATPAPVLVTAAPPATSIQRKRGRPRKAA